MGMRYTSMVVAWRLHGVVACVLLGACVALQDGPGRHGGSFLSTRGSAMPGDSEQNAAGNDEAELLDVVRDLGTDSGVRDAVGRRGGAFLCTTGSFRLSSGSTGHNAAGNEELGEGGGGCPESFPHASPPHANKICYTDAGYASRGVGPCGSWCTMDVSYS